MTIKQFIENDETLSNLNFMTAYQTILTIISKDMLSIDDFAKLQPISSNIDIYLETVDFRKS
jgi:hypothetical protein